MLIEKKDLYLSYKRELNEEIIVITKYCKEDCYKRSRGEGVNEKEDMQKYFILCEIWA